MAISTRVPTFKVNQRLPTSQQKNSAHLQVGEYILQALQADPPGSHHVVRLLHPPNPPHGLPARPGPPAAGLQDRRLCTPGDLGVPPVLFLPAGGSGAGRRKAEGTAPGQRQLPHPQWRTVALFKRQPEVGACGEPRDLTVVFSSTTSAEEYHTFMSWKKEVVILIRSRVMAGATLRLWHFPECTIKVQLKGNCGCKYP